ncbi:MAG TPA: hypothetical protein DD738_06085, partial [Ruminiclostridium sp.]|nr:hypothetical protein [Ruminiclostridium sp.]
TVEDLTPTVEDLTPTDKNELIYPFPEDSTSPQIITFQTKIPDSAYYNGAKISNTAKLIDPKDSNKELASGTSDLITIKLLTWISKEGVASYGGSGDYKPGEQYITWTITANKPGKKLTNVVITDVIPAGLTWDSAQWQIPDESSGWTNQGSKITSVPADSKYTLTNVSTPIRLVIVTKVTNLGDYTTKITNYENTASITWDGLTGSKEASKTVGVGYAAITKNGKADPSTRTIKWEIKVDPRGQDIQNLTVYDLLVHADGEKDSKHDFTGTTTKDENNSSVTIPVDASILGDLKAQYNQKFDAVTNDGGITVTNIPIYKDGKHVADLLEITGFPTNQTSTITFETIVTNPNIFAGNGSETVSNTATMFSGTKNLQPAEGTVDYQSDMLRKGMLKRTTYNEQGEPAKSVEQRINDDATTDAALGYDYIDKSVVYRLVINGDGLDMTYNEDKTTKQEKRKTIVTDTLPKGWEFREFDPNQKYLIFEAEKGGTAGDAARLDSSEVLGVRFETIKEDDEERETVEFTFTGLKDPYVILLKAGPTDKTLKGDFASNGTDPKPENKVSMKTTWGNITPDVNASQTVSIKTQVLKKEQTKPANGVLKWTVNYSPNLVGMGTAIQDTLS